MILCFYKNNISVYYCVLYELQKSDVSTAFLLAITYNFEFTRHQMKSD